jgi:hypothetical protein
VHRHCSSSWGGISVLWATTAECAIANNETFHRRSQMLKCYPQPCGDFCPKLLYLSNDIASAPFPRHLAPGVRRCSAISFRLGGACVFFGRPSRSFVANNEHQA